MIIDDEPVNLRLLKAILSTQGYSLLEAEGGLEGIEKAKRGVDLILLDIMMPDVDGFETCLRLKADEATKDIPVIFLSAVHNPESKALGFEKGGVDYVNKPFSTHELLARIKAHLTIRQQRVELQNYATQLEQMVEERTQQLIHADRLAVLGTFSAAIIHEINNPIMFISGNAELAKAALNLAEPALARHASEETSGNIRELVQRMGDKMDAVLDGCERITRIVNRLKDYGKRNDEDKGLFKLSTTVNDALHMLNYRVLNRGIAIETDIPENIEISGDRQSICQVFVNLYNNAIDAMDKGIGAISVRAWTDLNRVFIRMKDNGPGVPDELAEKIFHPFFTTKRDSTGTGLGMFIVRSILEEHNGCIVLLPSDGTGAHFEITLPLPEDPPGKASLSSSQMSCRGSQ
ncbi:MAG: hybrid sensor histidine kinase/response regulator [Deltaproteobacteria bacterium]|nr:hybrid sensor histidine kinase/response regulator [Deltaproteobacteria bacterium]